MDDVKLMNVEPFDMNDGRVGCCYYAISMDENYEETHEEPVFEKVEDFPSQGVIDYTK